MEELLTFVNEQLNNISKRKSYTVDEDGNEIECFDGECIYEDGVNDGEYRAYIHIRNKIEELSKM